MITADRDRLWQGGKTSVFRPLIFGCERTALHWIIRVAISKFGNVDYSSSKYYAFLASVSIKSSLRVRGFHTRKFAKFCKSGIASFSHGNYTTISEGDLSKLYCSKTNLHIVLVDFTMKYCTKIFSWNCRKVLFRNTQPLYKNFLRQDTST